LLVLPALLIAARPAAAASTEVGRPLGHGGPGQSVPAAASERIPLARARSNATPDRAV